MQNLDKIVAARSRFSFTQKRGKKTKNVHNKRLVFVCERNVVCTKSTCVMRAVVIIVMNDTWMLQIIMLDCMKSAIDRGRRKKKKTKTVKRWNGEYDAHSKSNESICSGPDGKELEIKIEIERREVCSSVADVMCNIRPCNGQIRVPVLYAAHTHTHWRATSNRQIKRENEFNYIIFFSSFFAIFSTTIHTPYAIMAVDGIALATSYYKQRSLYHYRFKQNSKYRTTRKMRSIRIDYLKRAQRCKSFAILLSLFQNICCSCILTHIE